MGFKLFESKNGAVLELYENKEESIDLLRQRLDLTTADGKKIGMWLNPDRPIFRCIQSLVTEIKNDETSTKAFLARIALLTSLVENGGFTSLEIAQHITGMLNNDPLTATKLLAKLEHVKEEWLSHPADDSAPVDLSERFMHVECRFKSADKTAVLSFIDTLISALKSLLNLKDDKESSASLSLNSN